LYAVVRLPSGTKSILLDHDGEIKLQQPTVIPISVGIGIGRALAPAGRSSDFDPTRAGQILLFRDESGSPVSHSRNSQQQATKPHLYLVLDDRQNEYSIYKMDMDSHKDEGHGSVETPLSLPEPPVLRIGPQTPIGIGAQFAALGSHIIATGPAGDVSRQPRVTLTYDTKTDSLDVSEVCPKNL
jgi:hypothetical protein